MDARHQICRDRTYLLQNRPLVAPENFCHKLSQKCSQCVRLAGITPRFERVLRGLLVLPQLVAELT